LGCDEVTGEQEGCKDDQAAIILQTYVVPYDNFVPNAADLGEDADLLLDDEAEEPALMAEQQQLLDTGAMVRT
jgi:hypothetical protein